jgi:transcriptional regulator with XRE-family HTH domain
MTGKHNSQSNIGVRIRIRRREIDWTQDQLARAIGVSRTTVESYEQGSCNPSSYRLKRIIRVLGVDHDFNVLKGE